MSELNFEKIFEELRNLQAIKKKYEESQSEIEKLKVSAAEQKLKIDVLEAEKLSLEAEKKSNEVRLNEVNLKLKIKTAEYDSLLAQRAKDDESSSTRNPLQPIQPDNEPIASTSSSRTPPVPKPRKRQTPEQPAPNSANKENLRSNAKKMCTRSSAKEDANTNNPKLSDKDINKYIDFFVDQELENGRDADNLGLKDVIERVNLYGNYEENFLDDPATIKRFCKILRRAQKKAKKRSIIINLIESD